MKYKKNDIIKVGLSGNKYHFYEDIKLTEIFKKFPVRISYQDLKETLENHFNNLYKDDTYKVFNIKTIRKITW